MNRFISYSLVAAGVLGALLSGSASAQVITSLSPSVRTAGGFTPFVLTVTGTGFCQDIPGPAATGTVITFNGVPHNSTSPNPTVTPSTTSASTTIATAEVMAPGPVSVTITNLGCSVGTSAPFTFTINPPLTLSPATLPNGAVGSPYNRTVTAAGGTPPYAPPIADGSPCDGGSGPPSTSSPGSINFSFTPATQTFYRFAVVDVDSAGGGALTCYFVNIDVPTTISPSLGTPQSTIVNTNYTTVLQVLVQGGASFPIPIEGAQITFSAPGSGATGTFVGPNVVFTDNTGHASVVFRANTVAGSFAVTATVAGITPTLSTTFNLTNLPGPPASISSTAGTPQTQSVGSTFSQLAATVRDSFGNAVGAGVNVTFGPTTLPGVGPGVASFTPAATVPTNIAGVATVSPTANTKSGGPYTVNASAPGTGLAPFSLTNTPGFPSSVTSTAGTPQSAPINSAFPIALRATVTDSFTNPVPGIQVTFAAVTTPGGPSGTFTGSPVVPTNAAGVAIAPTFTANGVVGGPYTVTATGAGVDALPASFSLTNTVGVPATITTTLGSGQNATVNTAYVTALQAIVRDANGNPVSNASVTFAVPGSGASGGFTGSATVQTDQAGFATAPPLTANTIAGNFNATATVTGVVTPALFALTNKPGAPASITATAGAGQSASINTAFPVAMKATVRDSFSNVIAGVSVTFTQPASGASGTFAGAATVVTDATGVATAPTFTSNAILGGYTVTASTAGVATPAAFGLTNNPGAPASITATSGMGQSTVVGFPFLSPLQAIVRDVGGNPVPNAQVTFGAPGSGASAIFNGSATVSTSAGGIATSPVVRANSIEGDYNATATVTGVATAATFALNNTGGVSITTTQLPAGIVGSSYGAGIGATGGKPPYSFSIASGSLPSGLQFSASGSISGTPLFAGLTSVQVQVTDGNGSSSSRTLTLRVVAQLSITTSSSLPIAFAGQGYGVTFSATGGQPPYSWTLFGGGAALQADDKDRSAAGLPPGMNFDSLTGSLTGTPTALGDYSFGVQVRDTANGSASKSFSLTSAQSPGGPPIVTPPNNLPPAVKVSGTTLKFQGPSGGDTPPPQYVSVVAANLEPLAATIAIDSGNTGTPAPPWLKARFVSAVTPARLAILTNQVGLPAGDYKGRVLVKYGTSQTLVIDVNFTIDLTPPKLTVAPNFLKFGAITGAGGVLEQALLVSNAGSGGVLDFTAAVVSSSPWLTVTPNVGKTVVSGGLPLRVLVNPQGLKIGSYLGKIRVQSPTGGTVEVPVSLFVSPNGPVISLSTVGVRFDAREGNGLANTREVAVLNVGTGTVNWNAALKIGGQAWASLNPASGQATPNTSGRLVIAADPRQLKAGSYYALIEISDPQALNSPQFIVSVLNVQPSEAPPEPDLFPSGLSFTAVAGGPNPATQTLSVFGGGDKPAAFQSAASSDDGANWLTIDKTNGAASTGTPGQLVVSVNSAGLKPGVYIGDVSVSFSSETIRTANVTLSVLPQGAILASTEGGDKQRSASGCTPGRLAITSTSLVNAFSSPAGWPTPLSVRVTDDCSSAVANAQVVATFSNGDPPLALALTNPVAAQYSGTWAPGRTASQMTVTVNGVAQGLSAATARLTGTIGVNGAPALTPNGTVNILSGTQGAAVAPGTIVQLSGGGLTPATAQPGVFPLPTTFNNTSILIGPFLAPVYALSSGQISAQIPTELQPDRQYPILVNNGGAFTLPDSVTITQASPGLLNMAQHTDFSSITQTSPASAGETIILYLVGMGATNPTVASGFAAPSDPPASTSLQPTVTIGGIPAKFSFAGLTPGLVGVYQINADVPDGVTPGDVNVTVTQNDFDSNSVTIPVR